MCLIDGIFREIEYKILKIKYEILGVSCKYIKCILNFVLIIVVGFNILIWFIRYFFVVIVFVVVVMVNL